MRFQARSSTRVPKPRYFPFLPLVIALCLVECAIAECTLEAEPQDSTRASQDQTFRVRFRVIDFSGRAIPEVDVSLVSWQRKESGFEKQETHQKSDEEGLVEFTVAGAERMMIAASAKGYRPYWRWIRVKGSNFVMQIKLELWANARK